MPGRPLGNVRADGRRARVLDRLPHQRGDEAVRAPAELSARPHARPRRSLRLAVRAAAAAVSSEWLPGAVHARRCPDGHARDAHVGSSWGTAADAGWRSSLADAPASWRTPHVPAERAGHGHAPDAGWRSSPAPPAPRRHADASGHVGAPDAGWSAPDAGRPWWRQPVRCAPADALASQHADASAPEHGWAPVRSGDAPAPGWWHANDAGDVRAPADPSLDAGRSPRNALAPWWRWRWHARNARRLPRPAWWAAHAPPLPRWVAAWVVLPRPRWGVAWAWAALPLPR
jgi:hypothetical protein